MRIVQARPPGGSRRRSPWAPFIVLTLGLVVAGGVTWMTHVAVEQRRRVHFDEVASEVGFIFAERFGAYLDAAVATAALFQAGRGKVSNRELIDFVHHFDLARRFPGIQSIGWSPRISDLEREPFVRTARTHVDAAFRIRPRGRRPVYHPVLYSVRVDSEGPTQTGLDLYARAELRGAMELARDSAQPVASPRTTLGPRRDEADGVGFVLFVPVYAGNVPETVDARRRHLRGFVFAAVGGAELARGVLGRSPRGSLVAVEVHDTDEPSPGNLLLRSSPADAYEPEGGTDLEIAEVINVAGRTWTVICKATSAFHAGGGGRHVVGFTMIGGIFLTLLLTSVTLTESRARARAEEVSAELDASRDALRRASEAKDHFIAMLGHELRTPLGAVASAANVLGTSAARSPAAERALEVIRRQVALQTRIVEDLLDVSRLSAGKVVLQRRPVDLKEIARRALADVGAGAAELGHRLSLHAPEKRVVVDGDPARLEQVLTNLLGNAVKYTPRGGRIAIHVDLVGPASAREAVLRVVDSGIGIEPHALERIFEPFSQTAEARHHATGGLGLGLTLVRRIAELHGGSVKAHSEGLGLGSELVVRLPAINAEAEHPEDEEGDCVSRNGSAPLRVLIVEDNEDARTTLADLLTLLGHDVATAEGGPEALTMARTSEPRVAFVDIGLPGMSGYDVARSLRQMLGRRVHLVALTGYGQEADRREALEAGFDDHFVKPLSYETLQRLLDELAAGTASGSDEPGGSRSG